MIAPLEHSAPVKLLLTCEEACAALGICRRTLYSLIHDEGLPVVRIGKTGIRFSVVELQHWIARQQGVSQ
jgi:excisionase family DNA binding protein